MEAIGAAASILQVLQISEQVVSACYQYYRTAKSAKNDILEVINIVGGLKSRLESLDLLIGDPADLRFSGPLKSCYSALESIATKLGINPSKHLNLAEIKVSLAKHLSWPWKRKEVEKILCVIEKQKTIFILALGGDTLQAVRSIQDTVEEVRYSVDTVKDRVEEVRDSVDTVITSQRCVKFLRWIKLADLSSNHNAARKKYEPTTGKSFLESEKFVSWMEGRISSIWVHGIPGAGKTILSSTVINHIDAACKFDPGMKYAYFYFDFSDPIKQTVNAMLRSLIQQLSIVDLAPEGESLYQQCGNGTSEPSQELLVETLVSLFQYSNRTFLIVDALDECSKRDDVCDVITRIIQAQRVGLLATSRNERDIARSLRRVIQNVTSLQEGEGIADDISLHVQRRLQDDVRLREWPPKIRGEIQEALVNGADGMYTPYF